MKTRTIEYLRWIHDQREFTTREMSDEFDITYNSARLALRKIEHAGFVDRVGNRWRFARKQNLGRECKKIVALDFLSFMRFEPKTRRETLDTLGCGNGRFHQAVVDLGDLLILGNNGKHFTYRSRI